MLILLLAVVSALRGEEQEAKEKVVFHDPFSGELAEGWTWVRQWPDSPTWAVAGWAMEKSWKVSKGGLVIRVLPGDLYAHTNDSRNILLRPRPAADEPWAIEVFLRSRPLVPYEHAGLIWYVDDDNYVGIFREYLGNKPQVLMVREEKAAPTFHYGGRYDDAAIWLRLEIADGKIIGKFRGQPEDDWLTIGVSDLPAPARAGRAMVGLLTGGAPADAFRVARFRDFRILTLQRMEMGDPEEIKSEPRRKKIERDERK
jgi:hypothetical protein